MGGKNIQARTDPELRSRFDRFKEDFGYEKDATATRKLVDEGLRANGYGPNGGRGSTIQLAFQAAGAVLVLFALGLFGFATFAPVAIIAWANPFAFMMLVAGGGFLFIATILQAASERRLPGIHYVRRLGG